MVKCTQCAITACYGIEGELPSRCAKHALPDMVNVVSKRCEHPGCSKQPTFNVEGEKNARFCKEHALPTMVDISHKKCEHPGCSTRPSYNLDGEKNGRFCKEHALSNMVDVVNFDSAKIDGRILHIISRHCLLQVSQHTQYFRNPPLNPSHSILFFFHQRACFCECPSCHTFGKFLRLHPF